MSRRGSTVSTDISEKTLSTKSKDQISQLVFAQSTTLSIIIENNKKAISYLKRLKAQKKNALNASSPPSISLISFLNRIKTYTELEDSTLINSMIYIDRLCAIAKLTLTPLNIHHIIIGSVICAIKYNEDFFFKFLYYAKVFGISVKELNDIEFNFLQQIQFDLHVSPLDHSKYAYYLTHFQIKEE